MPVIKVNGYKIRRKKGGLYPKVYHSRKAAKKRVAQMETFKHMRRSRSSRGAKGIYRDSWA